jgi:hypothetical protein
MEGKSVWPEYGRVDKALLLLVALDLSGNQFPIIYMCECL